MKRADIERIIKNGSAKERIRLYMTDAALVVVDNSQLQTIQRDGKLVLKGTTLLTAKERDTLYYSIKTPKDIEYYEDMRSLNKAFIYFMEQIKTNYAYLLNVYSLIDAKFRTLAILIELSETVNDLLEIYPDKESRKKAADLAKTQLSQHGIASYVAKKTTWFQAKTDKDYISLCALILSLNSLNKRTKEYWVLLTAVTKKELPLKPYKEWLTTIHKEILSINERIEKIISVYEKIDKPIEPTLVSYEAIEVAEITDEDVNDFKGFGA
jgi:hypothetical protein